LRRTGIGCRGTSRSFLGVAFMCAGFYHYNLCLLLSRAGGLYAIRCFQAVFSLLWRKQFVNTCY